MARDKKEVRKSNVPLKNVNENKKGVLIYREGMTVSDVATGLGKPLGEIIKKLMFAGIMATQNQTIDRDTVELIALEYDTVLQNEVVTDVTRFDEIEIQDDEKDLRKRPAVVTIMGRRAGGSQKDPHRRRHDLCGRRGHVAGPAFEIDRHLWQT